MAVPALGAALGVFATSPNYLPAELHNLIFVALACVLVLWVGKLARQALIASELRTGLRRGTLLWADPVVALLPDIEYLRKRYVRIQRQRRAWPVPRSPRPCPCPCPCPCSCPRPASSCPVALSPPDHALAGPAVPSLIRALAPFSSPPSPSPSPPRPPSPPPSPRSHLRPHLAPAPTAPAPCRSHPPLALTRCAPSRAPLLPCVSRNSAAARPSGDLQPAAPPGGGGGATVRPRGGAVWLPLCGGFSEGARLRGHAALPGLLPA